MVLMEKIFDEFKKIDGKYISNNFDESDKKIMIKINGGVSSVQVNWY